MFPKRGPPIQKGAQAFLWPIIFGNEKRAMSPAKSEPMYLPVTFD